MGTTGVNSFVFVLLILVFVYHRRNLAELQRMYDVGAGGKRNVCQMAVNYASPLQVMALENATPQIYGRATCREPTECELNEDITDEIDAREIFDLIRDIGDPEHPLTLEELGVVKEELIEVSDSQGRVKVQFTPTIPHCSMATVIGLCIRVKLLRSLPRRFKVSVSITPGTHSSADAVNKQLADKERIAAALENAPVLSMVNQCLKIREE